MRDLFSNLVFFAALLTSTSCVAVVPLVEPDEQALGIMPRDTRERADVGDHRVRVASGESRTEKRLRRYIRIMEIGEPVERAHAAYWLGEMGPRAARAVPALIANLRHDNHWVRRASAKALGKIGGPEVVAPLKEALKDRNRFVAHSAANALKRIGTHSARAALRGYNGM